MAMVILGGLIALNVASEQPLPAQPGQVDSVREMLGTPFSAARQALFDSYQKIRPRVPESQPVSIVTIDERSLKEIGQWPWPRTRLAELITRIAEAQPAAIGLDIYMPEPDQTSPGVVARDLPTGQASLARQLSTLPSHEVILAQALRAAPTVLGAAGFDQQTLTTSAGLRTAPLRMSGGDDLPQVRNYPWILASLPQLQAAASGQALLSVDLKENVARRMPLIAAVNEQLVPSLAMELLRVATQSDAIDVHTSGDDVEAVGVADLLIPTLPNGDVWLYYATAESGAPRNISAAAVLRGEVSADQLTGKLVLIGLTGLGLSDQRTTALGESVPGIEIQAQLLESLFEARTLQRPWWMKTLETALIALMGGFLVYAVARDETGLTHLFQTVPRAPIWMMLLLTTLVFGSGYLAFRQYGYLFDAAAAFITLSAVAVSLAYSAMVSLSRRNATLDAERQHLRESALVVSGELLAAQRIQMGSLPKPEQVLRGESRFELAAFLEPARDVGGDLYDFFMIDSHRLCFVIGDVSGKGVPASLFMAVSKTLTKTIASHVNADPGHMVELANAALASENPENLFVTLVLGILDVDTGALALVNAGHDAPLCRGSDGSMRVLTSPAECGGPPLCMMDDFPYAAQHEQLQPGDTLCLITDGVTEAMNRTGQIYSGSRLAIQVETASASNPAALIEAVRADVQRHVDGAEPSDDMTVLVIRWTPPEGNGHGPSLN